MDPFTRGGDQTPPESDVPSPGPAESAPGGPRDAGQDDWFTAGSSEERTGSVPTPTRGYVPPGEGAYGAGYTTSRGIGEPPPGSWAGTPADRSGSYVPPGGRPEYGAMPSGTYGTPGQANGYPAYGYRSYPPSDYWQPPAPRRGGPRNALIAIAIVAGVALLVLGFGGGIGAALYLHHLSTAPAAPRSGGGGTRPGSGGTAGRVDLNSLAEKLDPSIVDITGVEQDAGGQTVEEDAGTGVIITHDGEVLTNNHVIEGDDQLQAALANGTTHPLKVLGEDPTDDIALVQIQGVSNLRTMDIQSGARATVSEGVAAFGNALGRGGTPTASQGSVTNLDQTITASLDGSGRTETLSGLIEMSAQICPGDSGGVLANAKGQYLGMLTAAAAPEQGNGGGSGGYGGGGSGGSGGSGGNGGGTGQSQCSSDGFVIPAAHAGSVVKEIESGKRSAKVIIGVPGFLGVEVQQCTDQSAQQGQCQPPAVNGAQVTQLVSGGAAAQAGLPQSFLITGVNGAAITNPTDLTNALDQTSPGTTIQLTWAPAAGAASQTTSVTLGSGPPA